MLYLDIQCPLTILGINYIIINNIREEKIELSPKYYIISTKLQSLFVRLFH